MGRTTIIDGIMNEYVVYGGPIVTRAVAYRSAQRAGLSRRELDYAVLVQP